MRYSTLTNGKSYGKAPTKRGHTPASMYQILLVNPIVTGGISNLLLVMNDKNKILILEIVASSIQITNSIRSIVAAI